MYIVLERCSGIFTFCATKHEFLRRVDVDGLSNPTDIAACELTSRLYIGDNPWYVKEPPASILRASADLTDVNHWLPRPPSDAFRLGTLSVTSARLLVMPVNIDQLLQFDADGDELRRVPLPREAHHAVESPTGTFIVAHKNKEPKQQQVSEVNTEGQVLRLFCGSRLIPLSCPEHIAVDSQGNIFVADSGRILLLDAQLALRRAIVDEHQLNKKLPLRLCYIEQSGRLLVGFYDFHNRCSNFAVFDVLHQ